ncbi:hypothetical protein BU15DRAFT_84530 [Melanogaster broomeanus]|nr:hypothetical protein BU15DRAFT_84530 [Melanogaster broomeanus]
MSFTPREIGTLIVVVLKAKNLPNKRHIGKQAPYCLVTLNEDKKRTKVIKRGGQHPEWDEEFRFSIYEDVEAGLVRSMPGSDIPPPLPPKKKGPKKIKGGNFMRLQCYADDARDPDFIGEALVDLTEALTKGETDGKCTHIMLKFYLQEPPPEKQSSRQPTISNKNYGGPGSFVPADGSSPSLNGSAHSTPLEARLPVVASEINHLDSLPSSLRVSGSRPELSRMSLVDQTANDFAELGVMDHRKRESYPQGQGDGSDLLYETAITPTAPPSRLSLGPSPYYNPYENDSAPTHPPPARYHGPSTPAPTTYGGMSSYSSEPSTFCAPQGPARHLPPSPHPATPSGYSPHHHPTHPTYTPVAATPAPYTAPPPPPPLSATSHRMSHHTSQTHNYQPYQPPPLSHEQAVPFPSQEYGYPAYAPTTPSPPLPSSSTIGSRPDRRLSVAQLDGRIPSQPASATFPSSDSYPPNLAAVPTNYRRIPSTPGLPPPSESTNSYAPPLPTPPSQGHGTSSLRRPSLPQPPLGYHPVQLGYQPLPPPPPADMPQHAQLPLPSFPYSNYGQPLPTPPVHGD